MSVGNGWGMSSFYGSFRNKSRKKKRICILRGLIQDKEVYIFDEPTNELDAENTNTVLKEINKLKKKAIVMVVTHDKRMIDKADQVVVINNAVRKEISE